MPPAQPSKSSHTREPNPSGAPTFESAIEEVETIIRRIETGEVGLEDSLAQYERGIQLIKHCRGVLEKVEARVLDLTSQMKAGSGGPAMDA